jgi:hypothetical protein
MCPRQIFLPIFPVYSLFSSVYMISPHNFNTTQIYRRKIAQISARATADFPLALSQLLPMQKGPAVRVLLPARP